MAALSQEEKLFLELARSRGSISQAQAQIARVRATTEKISVVETLTSMGAISVAEAEAIRRELVARSFSCARCANTIFVGLDEQIPYDEVCPACGGGARPAEPREPRPSERVTRAAPPPDDPSLEDRSHDTAPPASFTTLSAEPQGAFNPPTERMAARERFVEDVPAGPQTERVKLGNDRFSEDVSAPATVAPGAGYAPGTAPTLGRPVEGEKGPEVLPPGTIIGGCKLEQRIGQGGMSVVYRAQHLQLQKPVAVKVLDKRLVNRPGFVEQFLTEARMLAQLDHPNVVHFYEAAREESSGLHYIVMELLEGGSFQTIWEKSRRRLPLDQVVQVAKEAAMGLEHAHSKGLIHRDVKPANLMLDGEGHVKVVDFGVAIPAQKQVFVATEIVGTLHYMAPEQIDGLPLDPRCDQYELGCTLFQLLCGKLPFERDRSIDVLFAHVNEAPPLPRELRPDVPVWLEQIILKLLAKQRDDRFANLGELVTALEKAERSTVKVETTKKIARPIELAELRSPDSDTSARRRVNDQQAWRRVLLVSAASVAAAVLFLLGPARQAIFSTAEAHTNEPAVVVLDAEQRLQAPSREARGAALGRVLAELEQEIQDLRALPGVERLQMLKGQASARFAQEKKQAQEALEKETRDFLSQKRYAAAIDALLADPAVAELDLAPVVRAERARVQEALAQDRGEVYVPGGPFFAGPQGTKTPLEAFYIDRTEVRNADYLRAMAEHGLSPPAHWPQGQLDPLLAQRPVTGLSFEEALRYAKAIGKRLPTSLEWEKAARGADDARAYPWGAVFEPGNANLFEGGTGALEDVTAREKDVSPLGALGMAGNALEWVSGENGRALVAGGGYQSQAESARVFERLELSPKTRHPAIGFRCARDVESR